MVIAEWLEKNLGAPQGRAAASSNGDGHSDGHEHGDATAEEPAPEPPQPDRDARNKPPARKKKPGPERN